jgi:hypothetical protein
MRKLLSIALSLPLAACVIGQESPGTGGDDDDGGSNMTPVPDGSITGLITAPTTWRDTVLIGFDKATTQIEPNTTVTVAAGTTIKFKASAGLIIKGTLKIEGTSAAKVKIEPVGDNAFPLIVDGILDMKYAVMTRGNIQTSAGSTTTIVDSKMYKANGDLVIMNGGTLNMTYSQIGPGPGEIESTHCNLHTSGNANTIVINNSDINGAPYGFMLYGGQNADLKNNNWYANEIDLSTQPGVSGDLSGSWFDGAPPVAGGGATLTVNNVSATRLANAGVRP